MIDKTFRKDPVELFSCDSLITENKLKNNFVRIEISRQHPGLYPGDIHSVVPRPLAGHVTFPALFSVAIEQCCKDSSFVSKCLRPAISLVSYILKQLFTSVSVKVTNHINYSASRRCTARYDSPATLVNYC